MKLNPCDNFEKMRKPKKVVLDKSFAGIKAGMTLYVGTPYEIADYIMKIPSGETSTVSKMRNQLARKHRCDAMCPVSTAIFTRIVADYSIHQMNEGKTPSEVIPFWRILESNDKISKRLPIDPEWIDEQREFERG